MKKRIFAIVLFTFVIAFLGCKKASKDFDNNVNTISFAAREGQEAENPEMVAYYSDYFLTDSSMALVFEKFMYNSVRMRGVVLEHGGNEALEEWDVLIHSYSSYDQVDEFYLSIGIDTADMKQMHSEPLASWLNLIVKNQDFYDLSMNDQELVINNIQATLTD